MSRQQSGHGHDHAHDHGHEHTHTAQAAHAGHHGHYHHSHAGSSRGYALGFALNLAFVLIEFTTGLLTNSLSLLADAGHNLSDIIALALAWGATVLSRRKPSARYTYGLRGTSIWAALVNALLLVLACGAIAWEALQRLQSPQPVATLPVIVVAAIGVLINTATALMFMRDSHKDLNRRGVYLHMMADAAVSLGVVISTLVMLWTGWHWLDPATSLVIVAVILGGTWGLLRDSANMSLLAVPASVDTAAVADYLRQCPGVTGLHDLHIWSMSTSEIALTAHLVVPGHRPGDDFYARLSEDLEERFGIQHATVQVECGDASHPCRLAPDDVV
jgi:cobalt-zinc-cadmium efflux system protein